MNYVVRLARVLSPACKEVVRLQSESASRKLSPFEAAGLRVHLLLCRFCRRYGEQMKFLRAAAPECDEPQTTEMPKQLSTEARERIQAKIGSSRKFSVL